MLQINDVLNSFTGLFQSGSSALLSVVYIPVCHTANRKSYVTDERFGRNYEIMIYLQPLFYID